MKSKRIPVVPKEIIIPFVMVTSLFALWGFANDITNPMVAAFASVMEISTAKAALVQFAFYGGYATMAIPAALFVIKRSYKSGLVLGLSLYALGALLFYPAAKFEVFGYFLVSLYILTFGLAFLETTASPYILAMGPKETATRRLNLAQAFNPIGSLLGMFVASKFVLTFLESDKRDEMGELVFSSLSAAEKALIRSHDLTIIRNPYLILGGFVILMLIIISCIRMPRRKETAEHGRTIDSFRRLLTIPHYREGVLAQLFYVAAQIMCWTFIIQYAEHLGIPKAKAQNYNIIAMVVFLISRFICTYLMKFVNPKRLLLIFALCAMITTSGVILIEGLVGLYLLVGTSAFMSLMFPTIYGIALDGLIEEDAPLGAAGLVMAIVGGALMPILQGLVIDMGTIGTMPAVNVSFILPLFCFLMVAIYGFRAMRSST
jgi:FHS family L-fucose permease-like MFS transporter